MKLIGLATIIAKISWSFDMLTFFVLAARFFVSSFVFVFLKERAILSFYANFVVEMDGFCHQGTTIPTFSNIGNVCHFLKLKDTFHSF